MSDKYFNLKRKLEELGYNYNLPLDGVPLVECILADLLQTTRSLQHYMDLSKDAITQRDKLILEIEPYKFDNAKLIQDNNQLHKELMILKEQIEKKEKDCARKIKSLSEELIQKDNTISKLQHELRELNLRGLCAETISSRSKSRKKLNEIDRTFKNICVCGDNLYLKYENDILELTKKIQSLSEENAAYMDEIMLLKNQVESRDNEIIRLNILLEGGRPIHCVSNEFISSDSNTKIQDLYKQLRELKTLNESLQKEVNKGLEKQHEAMLRALNLADTNKYLKDELTKVDDLALSVEKECNKKMSLLKSELNILQRKLEELTMKNLELEKQLGQKSESSNIMNIKETLKIVSKEKDMLQQEVNDLLELNKSLQEKIISFSNIRESKSAEVSNDKIKYATEEDLKNILELERKTFEKLMSNLQDKLTDTINNFEKHLTRCKNNDSTPSPGNIFIKDLHNKLCESEQKNLMLKKENEELQIKIYKQQDNNKQSYKDIINHLNIENSDLIKENLALSKELTQYKNSLTKRSYDTTNYLQKDISKFKIDLEELRHENELLKKDKQEYKLRYQESMDLIENLKKDLLVKQRQVQHLEEENCSYKMTNRTDRASTEHLKDECNFLREQIKRMQTDVIKEKALANQIKNIQIETERSSNEVQNELLSAQKKISVLKNNIDSLERKCSELQSEVSSLKNDKFNLIDNIKKIDKERDELVIELDHKTETMSVLEQKLKSQSFEIQKLESEIADLKRKLNINKISEHKLIDSDAQIKFLNGEISKLTLQLENAIIENKQLQNSLADANGSLKITKIEYEKSRKEVDGLKQQLQHYVAEIRRIEELLSQKEAERSDMLEHFASLSVEANILENTNHSLESESASKSLQLQSYINKIHDLESKIIDKDNVIDNQSARIATMLCKVTALESEVKLISEEKEILEKNVCHLKQMCNNLQSEKSHITKDIDNTDSELKLYENKIRSLSSIKAQLEMEKVEMKTKMDATDKLLSNARKEVIELKLALQDATSETKALQERIRELNKSDPQDTEVSKFYYL